MKRVYIALLFLLCASTAFAQSPATVTFVKKTKEVYVFHYKNSTVTTTCSFHREFYDDEKKRTDNYCPLNLLPGMSVLDFTSPLAPACPAENYAIVDTESVIVLRGTCSKDGGWKETEETFFDVVSMEPQG